MTNHISIAAAVNRFAIDAALHEVRRVSTAAQAAMYTTPCVLAAATAATNKTSLQSRLA